MLALRRRDPRHEIRRGPAVGGVGVGHKRDT
jgi:hypothetical protein